MKERFSKFGLVVALLLALAPRSAEAATFLQFQQVLFNSPFVVNETAGVTTITATNVPVTVNFDESFCLVVGCGGVTDGVFLLNFSTTSTSPATLTAGVIEQNFGGAGSFISFTQPGVNLLTVTFSDEVTGSAGGTNPTLNAAQPPDVFSGSSSVLDPLKLGIPRGFSLSFSNWMLPLAINNNSIADATADATGTFNATPQVGVVPEPASLLLLGSGLAAVAARRRQTRKNKQV
jgi:PEP-CTERM motif